ncbi:MAG TPA: DUF1385 domain-containing protein [Candidatus Polarisedimenticolia bacterium]|nr:DUF1385 domain-containing protein [Candidatus Polarisedimenticolia bacterium]
MPLLPVLMLAAGENVLLGGQAVIEGVMMRAPDAWAVAVRRADGRIVTTRRVIARLSDRYPFLRWALVRGAAALIQSLILGIQSLNFSAEQAVEDGGSAARLGATTAPAEAPVTEAEGAGGKAGTWAVASSLLIAAGLGVGIFLYLPLLLTEWMRRSLPLLEGRVAFNLTDGLLRLGFFLVYIVGISLLRDIRRLFQYHGAEHKVVATYEAGEDLTVDNARRHSPLHPRCGTSFLLFVMVISVLVFAVIGSGVSLAAKLTLRLVLVPLIAGLAYEVIRLSARHRKNLLCAALIRPGLWLQRLTTRQPEDDQLAVAIQALLAALGGDPRARGEYVPL